MQINLQANVNATTSHFLEIISKEGRISKNKSKIKERTEKKIHALNQINKMQFKIHTKHYAPKDYAYQHSGSLIDRVSRYAISVRIFCIYLLLSWQRRFSL